MAEAAEAPAVAQLTVTTVPGQQLSSRLPSQIEQTQRQVDEVVQVMRKNLENIEARERNLNELELRAATLETQAQEFHVASARIQRKMWWKDMKWTLIAVGTVSTIIIIVVVVLAVQLS
ncbi:hypothetical protein GHT06_014307 [Daphnia sinensis]|uniref:V-SNARE coiled-coil homology domain-containing protein n=1 Tax=Daphnia sinensis TaxID=1820382 RepID=A0AAD5KTL2_9CRUS|nr:hypothetical protein GHT06_014307 [Daphnia sinensis]